MKLVKFVKLEKFYRMKYIKLSITNAIFPEPIEDTHTLNIVEMLFIDYNL